MLDFTSSLYLGIKHSCEEICSWQQLTTGVPAALAQPVKSIELAQHVADLQGLPDGLTMPSTLHIYHDLYKLLSTFRVIVYIDEYVYPVSKYGVEKLLLKDVPVYNFKHQDAAHLKHLINLNHKRGYTPVVITDGWCPVCGTAAPLNLYTEILQNFNGFVVVDDTQAFGVFGRRDGSGKYGKNGGGILPWLGVKYGNTICVTSLAKAFGAPLAVISGSKKILQLFKESSDTLSYSSPANFAAIAAGLRALYINGQQGDHRREKLFEKIHHLKKGMQAFGVELQGGMFPVQSVSFRQVETAINCYDFLKQKGINTVLTQGHLPGTHNLTFVVTTNHRHGEIDFVIDCLYKFLNKKTPAVQLRTA